MMLKIRTIVIEFLMMIITYSYLHLLNINLKYQLAGILMSRSKESPTNQ